MKTVFVSLGILFCGIVNAQLSNPQQKLILYNGEVLTGNSLLYHSPILKPAEFVLDGLSYETSMVEFFQNKHGYFANLSNQNRNSHERYALCIRMGKVNLFEEIDMEVYGGEELIVEENAKGRDPMLASGEYFQFYTKGNEAVKKATYRNMKVDLSDNEASMKHLKAFKKYQLLQWGLIGVGSGLIAANVINQAPGAVKFNPVMAIGFVIGGSSYFLQSPKSDSIWLAADEYNKHDIDVVSTP